MKAAILHRGGRIREKRAKETIGFDACVRRSLSDGTIKYLKEEQALVLQESADEIWQKRRVNAKRATA